MNTNPQTRPRPALGAPKIRDLIYSVMLFLASRASIIGIFPFGTAFFAACFDKSCAYLGIFALLAGVLSANQGMGAVKYLIAALIYWIYTAIRGEERHPVSDSVVCGVSVLIGGGAVLVYSFLGLYDIVVLIMEAIASALMYIIFSRAKNMLSRESLRHGAAKDELISMALTAGVLITGLDGVNLPFNIGLSRVISVYVIMVMAARLSLTAAASGGMCVGFVTFMAKTGAPAAMGVYGMSALFANLLKGFGRFGVAIGFLGGAAAAMLYTGAAMPLNLQEAALGALLYIATPRRFLNRVTPHLLNSVHVEAVDPQKRVKDYLSMRLLKTADAFSALGESFVATSDKRLKLYNRDAGILFDQTAARVCEGCKRRDKCWGDEFTRTYRNIMSLLSIIESEGALEITSLPNDFRDTCVRGGLFVLEFNHVYELYRKNMIRTGEAVAGRDLAAKQYVETAAIMNRLSKEIDGGFKFLEKSEEELVYELSRAGIGVNEISVIENGSGKIEAYMLLENRKDISRVRDILSEVFAVPMGEYGSEGNMIRFAAKPRYSIEAAVKSISKGRVCGDESAVFCVEEQRAYVILSDGMGIGSPAAAQSGVTVNLLRRFLEAGFDVLNAVSMINSALCLNLDKESFATVDVLCVDLISGEAKFYKIGSAQSMLLHRSGVEIIYSNALPVGMLTPIKLTAATRKVCDGDIILMMSDGVSEAQTSGVRTDWLEKLLQRPHKSIDNMAEEVLLEAVERSGGNVCDDMTAAAVRIIEN